jgi:hypothetical protein
MLTRAEHERLEHRRKIAKLDQATQPHSQWPLLIAAIVLFAIAWCLS